MNWWSTYASLLVLCGYFLQVKACEDELHCLRAMFSAARVSVRQVSSCYITGSAHVILGRVGLCYMSGLNFDVWELCFQQTECQFARSALVTLLGQVMYITGLGHVCLLTGDQNYLDRIDFTTVVGRIKLSLLSEHRVYLVCHVCRNKNRLSR